MDRRDSLKTLLIGTVAGGLTATSALQSCQPKNPVAEPTDDNLYGRLPEEIARDKALFANQLFSTHELETIAILCDIILPATPTAGSATEAGVHEFIEFIAKDMAHHQLPLRGGLMWLDAESNSRYKTRFSDCSESQQIHIIDDIAYPATAKPPFAHGVKFFNLMRDLTLTGYYTTKMGFQDLGYKGNIPNVWDGVPQDVLEKHGLSYDEAWLAKCVDQSKRNDIAEWDDQGNLLT